MPDKKVVSRSRIGPWFMLGSILVVLGVGITTSVSPLVSTTDQIVTIAFSLLGVALIVYNLTLSLIVTEQLMSIRIGLWARSVNLTSLTEVGWESRIVSTGRGTKFHMPFYIIRDAAGGKLRFAINQFFHHDNDWSQILLHAAEVTGATVDPRARRALEKSNGTLRRMYD